MLRPKVLRLGAVAAVDHSRKNAALAGWGLRSHDNGGGSVDARPTKMTGRSVEDAGCGDGGPGLVRWN